ncbi:MAG: class I SAM-dependent methyltransferase [Dehalococcoidia bacterium]
MSDFYDAEVYDARAQGVPGDVEFFLKLALEAHALGHPVLELACGTGRVAIPIAQAGVRVVGLDLRPSMLAVAQAKSDGLDVKNARWVEGDMRDFALPERFGLIYIPFRSFQHLLTVEDQLACLAAVREHLTPGGRFALNIFNPNIIAIAEGISSQRGSLRRRRDDYTNTRSGGTMKAWETRAYHTAAQEVESDWIDEELDNDGVVVSRVYRGLKLRYLFRYEMEHLLIRAGFEIEALYGDCFGAPFEDTSPEMVWVATKPA